MSGVGIWDEPGAGPHEAGRFSALRATHPEWWVLLASGFAWLVVAGVVDVTGGGSAAAIDHGHMRMTGSAAMPTNGVTAGVVVGLLLGWVAMVAAMMLPSALPNIRYVAFASLHTRRGRAMGLFSAGYLLVWLPLGAVTVLWHVFDPPSTRIAGGLALALAALWELTPQKRSALIRCRRTIPIRARGFAADRSCARFGALSGVRCVSACGPAMAAVVVAGHTPAVLALVTGAMFVQRVWRRGERFRAPVAGLIALAAVATVLS